MRLVGRTLLVVVTIVFLLSMGGGMLYVWWALVPLHWLAARDAGPRATAGWALLAGASIGEVAWMTAYAVLGDGAATVMIGVAGMAATSLAFLSARARRVPA